MHDEDFELTGDDISKFKQAFSLFDTDGDGSISTKDLQTIMKQLGHDPTEAELRDMVKEVDRNGSGTVNFKEFVMAVTRSDVDDNIEAELIQAFKMFDWDGDGLISAPELKYTMTKLGEKLTDQEVNDLMKQADLDNDGYINLKEFKKFMTKDIFEFL